jgi:hypothetical protein
MFPKQARLADGPGSLIRLPFGVHRLTSRRYGFVTPGGEPLAPTIRQQIARLAAPKIVSEAAFESYQSFSSPKALEQLPRVQDAPTGAISEKIKTSISVLEFVSRYVDLKPTDSGAVGLCPFHDDHHPSFAVNADGDYWCCFAGCGGGSIVDFWMKWRGCDFKTAVAELAKMILP